MCGEMLSYVELICGEVTNRFAANRKAAGCFCLKQTRLPCNIHFILMACR